MKVIYSKILPPKGFMAINLFGVVFVKEKYKTYEGTYHFQKMLNHEGIHTKQMQELGYIFFYIIYFIEWLYRVITPPWSTAYRDISFEKEAYEHEKDFNYIANRQHFSQWYKNSQNIYK